MGNQKNWTLRQLLSHPYLVYLAFILIDVVILHCSKHAFWHSIWHIFLPSPDILSCSLFANVSDNLAFYCIWHSFWHVFWHLPIICFGTLSDIYSDYSDWHSLRHAMFPTQCFSWQAWDMWDILKSKTSFCVTGAGHRTLFHPCGGHGAFCALLWQPWVKMRGGFGSLFSW